VSPHYGPDANPRTEPNMPSRRDPKTAASQAARDAQMRNAGGADIPDAIGGAEPIPVSRPGADTAAPATNVRAIPTPDPSPVLLDDPLLYIAAAVLDDTETAWLANRNRLRALTSPVTPAGEKGPSGWGMTPDSPYVLAVADLVQDLGKAEHKADLNLQRIMRHHPLGPWIKGQVGIGDRQAARLLAAIGDPYWNKTDKHPRTTAQLWTYCGYNPGQKRQRGQKGNWSAEAKMRVHLIAKQCLRYDGRPDKNGKPTPKSPYRAVYDNRRAHTAITHPEWTLAHLHNDALRIVSKEILKDLWRAARDIHYAADMEVAA
jgi:hypothetical protein